MQRSVIIEKLQHIIKDDNYYRKNNVYKLFIDAKSEYEKKALNISPKEEMILLLKLISTLHENIALFNKKQQQIHNYNLQSQLLSRKTVLMEPVKKALHFICLGQMEAIQWEYINLWVHYNPDYAIKIWTDDRSYLARELAGCIQEKASKKVLSRDHQEGDDPYTLFKTQLIRAQNIAYAYLKGYKNSNAFNQDVKYLLNNPPYRQSINLRENYLAAHQRFAEAFSTLGKNNPQATLSLQSIDDLGYTREEEHQLYIKELILRSNFTAASDIYRLMILKKQGGICLDTDVLPEINNTLFTKVINTTPDDPQGMRSQAVILRVILNGLMKAGKMPARAAQMAHYQCAPIEPEREQAIQRIITSAENKGIPLFMPLMEVKVDPYFQCNYMYDSSKVIAAQANSPLINRVLKNLKSTHEIIDNAAYNINGLSETLPLPERISPALQNTLSNKPFALNGHALTDYRHPLLTRDDRVTPELAGIRAYDRAYFQLLRDINIESFNGDEPYLFQSTVTQSFTKASFLTDVFNQSHLVGSMGGRKVLAECPRYYALYLIQLDNHALTTAAARLLYHQHNRALTAWYRYDPSQPKNHQLIEIKNAAGLHLKHETRYMMVGHGGPLTLSAEEIASLLAKKSSPTHYSVVKREQLTLIGCGLTTTLPAPFNTLQAFIKEVYRCLNSKSVVLNSIVVQDPLFTVDILGHPWVGEWGSTLNWVSATPHHKKNKFTHNGNRNNTQLIEQEVTLRPRTITEFDRDHFSLSDKVQPPIVNPMKRNMWYTNDPEKLDGWSDWKTAQALKSKVQSGPVFMATADSLALIAGMSEGTHEIVIADSNDFRLATLMTALQHTVGKGRFEDWLNSLHVECGKQILEERMRALFSNIQDAFQRLQQRVLHHQFTFYHLDFSLEDNAERILAGKYSQELLQAIYLGNVDDFLLTDVVSSDDNQAAFTKVEKKLSS